MLLKTELLVYMNYFRIPLNTPDSIFQLPKKYDFLFLLAIGMTKSLKYCYIVMYATPSGCWWKPGKFKKGNFLKEIN